MITLCRENVSIITLHKSDTDYNFGITFFKFLLFNDLLSSQYPKSILPKIQINSIILFSENATYFLKIRKCVDHYIPQT